MKYDEGVLNTRNELTKSVKLLEMRNDESDICRNTLNHLIETTRVLQMQGR